MGKLLAQSVLIAFMTYATTAIATAGTSCLDRLKTDSLKSCHRIRIIVSSGPGGGVDLLARDIQRFFDNVNLSVLVENKAGANGLLATNELLKNGQCDFMMASPGPLVSNQLLPEKTTTQAMMDQLQPVSHVATGPLILAINTNVFPVSDVAGFLLALKQSNAATYASPGVFSTPHLAVLELENRLKIPHLIHAPAKDPGEARTLLIGGHVSFLFDVPAGLPALTKFPHIRILGSSGERPIPFDLTIRPLGDVPLLKGFNMNSVFGVVTHSRTSSAMISEFESTVRCLTEQKEFREKYEALGYEVSDGSKSRLIDYMRDEPKKLKPLMENYQP